MSNFLEIAVGLLVLIFIIKMLLPVKRGACDLPPYPKDKDDRS